MTYNEWRDELKNNLLNVSDFEKKRVLDYYAEAYADRRDAGYSEERIINDFGAPYDAAQRILLNIYDTNEANYSSSEYVQSESSAEKQNFKDKDIEINKKTKPAKKEKSKGGSITLKIVNVLLSIVLMFALLVMMTALLGMCAAPIGCTIASVASIIAGCIEFGSNVHNGVYYIGEGIFALGFGLIILPICIKLIKLFVKWLGKLWYKIVNLISGKERA